jgi:hypothetical protein
MSLTESTASPQRASAATRAVRPASRPPAVASEEPSRAEIRKFGVVMIIGFGLIGGLLAWTGRMTPAYVCWGVGAGIGLLAILLPGPARPVHRVWMAVARFLGRINTTILLSLFYLVMITGLGLIFRLIRRDALRLRRGSAESYWVPKKLPKDPASYFNQY